MFLQVLRLLACVAESRAFSSAGAGLQANAEQLIVNAAEYSLTVCLH